MPLTRLIVTADDFGRCTAINAAVIRAHCQGVLTSASLMVAGEAFDEAVALARENPTLAVGLHLVLIAGRAILPPAQIPLLVNERGMFDRDPLRAGVRYFFNRQAQFQLRAEIEAQLERFCATGLPLSHVDGHYHFHIHPTIFDILAPLAERYGARGVRLPRDDLRLGLAYDWHRAGGKLVEHVIFAALCGRQRRRLESSRLATTERVYGLLQSGQMREDYVMRVLQHVRFASVELYFHPSTQPLGERLGPNPGDLATLLSPEVRRIIEERCLCLTTYPALAGECRQ